MIAHPISRGSVVQRFARNNDVSYAATPWKKQAPTYRVADGWEDGILVEWTSAHAIVRVGFIEFVCNHEDVRLKDNGERDRAERGSDR